MRLVGLWVWVIMNLMFFGMAGYMYLLWVQFWRYSSTQEPLLSPGGKGAKYNVSRPFLTQVFRDGYETIQVRKGRPLLNPRSRAVGGSFHGTDFDSITPMVFTAQYHDDKEGGISVDARGVNNNNNNNNNNNFNMNGIRREGTRNGRLRKKKKLKKKKRKKAYEESYEDYTNEDGDEEQDGGYPPSTTPLPPDVLMKMIDKHKMALTIHLRTSQMDGGNILFKHESKYDVVYPRKQVRDPESQRPKQGELFPLAPSRRELLQELQKAEVRTLRDGDEPFTSEGLAKYFPSMNLLEGSYYNSCVVVSSAGSLRGSGLGKFIDAQDAVVRFNHAPTRGFKRDAGSKTTLRIVNSQIVAKPEFHFWESSLYQNVTVLIWDPSNYTSTLEQWYRHPDFDFFPDYFRRRLMLPTETIHVLHPASLWRIWRALQRFTHARVLPNPPSSGFLGIVLMLAHCRYVHVVEFVPSLRLGKRCHYWERGEDTGCTFGDWHPLATEKLLTMVLNENDDVTTYRDGYVTLSGFVTLQEKA